LSLTFFGAKFHLCKLCWCKFCCWLFDASVLVGLSFSFLTIKFFVNRILLLLFVDRIFYLIFFQIFYTKFWWKCFYIFFATQSTKCGLCSRFALENVFIKLSGVSWRISNFVSGWIFVELEEVDYTSCFWACAWELGRFFCEIKICFPWVFKFCTQPWF
jgi:hypothetical protein